MSTGSALRPGQAFGRYQIVRLIGEGGMGMVHEALHPGLKKRFAIKTLLPAIAQKEEVRTRFLREGEAASCINHPNVVSVSDVGTEDGVPFLVMEFLEGQTLGDFLAQGGPLDGSEALALLVPVISAVAAGHDGGVIHRDLKPQNIFLSKGHRGERIPKVLDFGVSKMANDDNAAMTRTMAVLGTAAYMSPEQARGAKHVDVSTDQYALGLILYEMLTGFRAHPGESSLEVLHHVASGEVRPARELMPSISLEVDAVLARMLAFAPSDRFSSLHECGLALLKLSDEGTRSKMANEFGPRTGVAVDVVGSAGAGRSASGIPRPIAVDDISAPAPGPRPRSVDSVPTGLRRATIPLPVATGPGTDTTLRHLVGEIAEPRARMPAPAAPARPVKIVAGLCVGAMVVVAGGLILGKRRSVSTQASLSPHSVVATSAGATSEASKSSGSVSAAAPGPQKALPAGSDEPPPAARLFEIRAIPSDAELVLDSRPPTRGRLEVVLPIGSGVHELKVSADGYLAKTVSFGPNEQPPAEIRLEKAAARRVASGTPENKPAKIAIGLKPSRSMASPAKKADCTPNFTLDQHGDKHFKPECFK